MQGTASQKLVLPEKTPAKEYIHMFTINHMASKGMNLTFIPPIIMDSEKLVKIYAKDIASEKAKCKVAIVLYVVGTTLSIGAMERVIATKGTFSSKSIVLYYMNGYFVIDFQMRKKEMMYCALDHIIYLSEQY